MPAPAPVPAPVLTPSAPPPEGPAFVLSAPVPTSARPEVKPLAEDRYALKLTISGPVRAKLLEAQALLRHRLPSGDLDVVLERALDALLGELRRRKFAESAKPRAVTRAPDPAPGSRHIPNHIKRAVAERDGHRCTFVDDAGRRCDEIALLEFDHVTPFARGGQAQEPADVRLRCKIHNMHAAVKMFGARFMERKITEAVARKAEARPGDSTQMSLAPG